MLINKERRLEEIKESYQGWITSLTDLTGGKSPSALFYLFALRYRKLFNNISDEELCKQIAWRRKAHPILNAILPYSMQHKQVIENREALLCRTETISKDKGITLPETPVIWMANHGFKDDVAATVYAAYRHAYILFGSIPQFFNTIDGISANINGVVMTNRKVKASTSTSIARAIQVINCGADLIILPEGVWNKTPNQLLLPFWSGIYRISHDTGAKIVPVIHYIRDPIHKQCTNSIHTVIDDPVDISGLSEKAALSYLRDISATWYYLLMEKYGDSTRIDAVGNYRTACESWEAQLKDLVATADRYDTEIELSADYRSREIASPKSVWESVAAIQKISNSNANSVAYANLVVEQFLREDFQRRF